MRMKLTCLCLLLVTCVGLVRSQDYPRQRILQDQSCYFEPFKKQLTCVCDTNLAKSFLLLRLSYNIRDVGQEIRSVQIQSCPDLLLSLDLKGVDPTNIPIVVRSSGVVTIDYVEMDETGPHTDPKDKQILSFSFNNVETVHFAAVNITHATQIGAVNVKKLLVTGSSFSVLPSNALTVTATRRLEIRDSIFYHVYPRSIQVEGVKDVFIINNQFNINVIKVVSAKDGKRLHISCNRLLDEPVSPECVQTFESTSSSYLSLYYSTRETTTTPRTTTITTTTPETTTTTAAAVVATTSPTTPSASVIVTTRPTVETVMELELSHEVLIGMAVGAGLIFILLLIILVLLCCKDRKKAHPEAAEDKSAMDANENLNPDTSAELNKLLMVEEEGDSLKEGKESMEEERSDTSPTVRFSSPVWIQEIQNNKIFAKQRSINSNEQQVPLQNGTAVHASGAAVNGTAVNGGLVDSRNGFTPDDTPRRSNVRIPVRSISEILEFEESEGRESNSGSN